MKMSILLHLLNYLLEKYCWCWIFTSMQTYKLQFNWNGFYNEIVVILLNLSS